MPFGSSSDAAPSPEKTAPRPYAPGEEIVAYAGSWYRKARYIMALIVFGCAAWFGYDGWVGYPKINAEFDAAVARGEKPAKAKLPDLDIQLQKVLALSLPILGVGIIVWLRYNSRGCYRLKDEVLYVPGHPPVPLDAIRQIDKSKWDKKGIAYLDYEIESPIESQAAKGTIKLDDFVYDQNPTDAIMAAIEKTVAPEEAE